MLVSLGVKNFRSFREKTDIKLKPITVFVGRNSCGKSSFLRLFPLFRQSFEAHTTGPVLWFGRYVDFGDFNNVLFRDAEEKEITFYFTINLFPFLSRQFRSYNKIIGKDKLNKLIDISVELTIGTDGQRTKYEKIKILYEDFEVLLLQSENKTFSYEIIDQNKKIHKFKNISLLLEKRNLSNILPQVVSIDDKDKESEKFFPKNFPEFYLSRNIHVLSCYRKIYKILKPYFSHNTLEQTVLRYLVDIGINLINRENLYIYLRSVFKDQKRFIQNLEKNYSKIYEEISPLLFLANLNSLLYEIDKNLNNTFSNIRYIAPIRAITERFYRFQDLQIDEMDHTGSNMAMLLNSLSSKDKKLFGDWVKENFNFSVKVDESGSHYTINIIDENNIKYNISDMGFGYSQLLPIIMNLWLETHKKETKFKQLNNDLIFVIEQPELHLHPAYQFQLGKLFSKIIAKASQSNIKIIVETHSQYFINALGESVEQKQISKDDISIVVFNKKDKETEIQEAYFDEDGTLENWPIGFFSGE